MCSSPAAVLAVSAAMTDEKKDASHSTPVVVKKKPCEAATVSKPATLVGEGAGGGRGAGHDEDGMGIQCSVLLTSRDEVLLLLLLLRRDVEDVFLRRPQPIFLLLLLPLLADLLDAPHVRVLLMPVLKKDGRRRRVLLRCWHVAASLSPSPSLLALLLAFIVAADDNDDFDLI